MAILRWLLTYPPTGVSDQPWEDLFDHGDIEADVLARTARPVSELYSEAVSGLGIEAHHSEIRVFCAFHEAPYVSAQALVDPWREGFETGFLHAPPGFHRLPAATRADLILQGLHGIALLLAEARGWSASLDECRDHVLDHDYTYRYDGGWKSAPDRRHRARLRAELAPDGAGHGRAWVEVADKGGRIVATSSPATAWTTSAGFQRSAQTLRWRGSTRVTAQPYSGWVVGGGTGKLRLDLVARGWREKVRDRITLLDLAAPDPTTPVPEVRVRPTGDTVPDGSRRISLGSGGPIQTRAIETFHDCVLVALEPFTEDAGRAWWDDAPMRHLDGIFEFQRPRTGVRTRVVGEELRLWIDVSDEDLRSHPPREWADHVARLIVAAVRRRTGLGPHPGFPGS